MQNWPKVKLDDSAFLRTQSYITEICYFEFLWSFEFWLAPHWDFFSKDPPIYPNTHTKFTKIKIRSSLCQLKHLLRITHLAHRKSYLVIICSNSHEKLTASPDGWAVLTRSCVHSLWLLVDHCVLSNWDRILVRAVKGLISRAGMVSICPLLWQRDVKLQQTTTWKVDQN